LRGRLQPAQRAWLSHCGSEPADFDARSGDR
jgi:hypothetical protein